MKFEDVISCMSSTDYIEVVDYITKENKTIRKVTGIVSYTDYGTYFTLDSMTVITSNKRHISCILREKVEPYHYEHFTDLYKSVLNVAKINGFYFDSFRAFETDWYDIVWIESAIPWRHQQFPYRER